MNLKHLSRLQVKHLYALLGSRLVMFLLFQSIIALIAGSWETSERYWLLTATLTNLVSIALLLFLIRNEGGSYLSLFAFKKTEIRKDLMWFALIFIISGPVIFLPGYFLSIMIWDNPDIPASLLFRPPEDWLVYVLLFTFPVTIVFAELYTYFGFIMPRLAERMRSKWVAILLPVKFLSLQHCTLPFIPDPGFVLYRALVFLPFALLIGLAVYFRPSLFPYFAILHGLMDSGTGIMFLVQPG